MQWILKGRKIGQAFKNVQRLRQVSGVLAKHGFADIVDQMDLGKFLPSRLAAIAASQSEQTRPEKLRMAFEELGPTFVKLGQLLSTRPDLIPEEYIVEFTKLQDNVQPLPFEVVKTIIERELKCSLDQTFSVFDSTPLAAASIGQVHEARLHSGEKVVVKVQRPEIAKVIATDVSLLAFLAGLLEKYVPETRIIGPKVIVEEFFKTLTYELDFLIEANNMRKIAENMRLFPEIVVPQVYREYSTQNVLTLEKIEGIRLNDFKAIDAAGIDRKKVIEVGARAFFRSVMIDGLFHGDLHGGNLFILPGNKLGIIDFGIVGRLSRKSRDQFANMMMSLLTEDYENLCYQYAELGTAGASIDFDNFQREVRNALSPYMGLSLSEMNIGRILIEATKIATRHQIKIPGDWMIVFKAILTIEGMARSLDPSFDLMAAGEELVKDLVKDQYSPAQIRKDLLWVAKDAAVLLQVLPRQVRWMFRKFNSNNFAIEIKSPDLEAIRWQLDLNGRRTSRSIAAAGLLIAGSIALQKDVGRVIAGYPVLAVILIGIGAALILISPRH